MPTAPYPAPNTKLRWFRGSTITSGQWFIARRWPMPNWPGARESGVYDCFIWRTEATRKGTMMLVAYGIDKRLRCTEERLSELMPVHMSFEPALHDFPLEWSRWIASGIGIYSSGRGLDPHITTHQNRRCGSSTLPWRGWDKRYTEAEIKWWLMQVLYEALHPRKAWQIEEGQGEEMLRQAVIKFIAGMEQREAKGLSPFPEKKPRRKADAPETPLQ